MGRPAPLLALVFLLVFVPGLAVAASAAQAGSASEPARTTASTADPQVGPQLTMTRSPTCGCCGKWAEHLEAHGFQVEVRNVPDVRPFKREKGVPAALSACHTAEVGGYVVEGHVPASDIRRLLEERPAVAGIAVPGMPEGSPGMEGPEPERYHVYAFDREGGVTVFATHEP